MTRVNFPKRNDDGSFCVEVGLKLGSHRPDLGARIQHWIQEDWIPNRSTWRRIWQTGPGLSATNEQVLRYEDEFIRSPEVISCERLELRLRLFGRKSARLWKDWLVSRLLPDLKASFPEVGDKLYINNCPK